MTAAVKAFDDTTRAFGLAFGAGPTFPAIATAVDALGMAMATLVTTFLDSGDEAISVLAMAAALAIATDRSTAKPSKAGLDAALAATAQAQASCTVAVGELAASTAADDQAGLRAKAQAGLKALKKAEADLITTYIQSAPNESLTELANAVVVHLNPGRSAQPRASAEPNRLAH